MKNLKLQIMVSMGLGVLALVSGIFVHLALTDISHLEPDGTQEWFVVQAGAGIFILFIGFSLATLWRILRQIQQ